jgi:hypothetical protein
MSTKKRQMTLKWFNYLKIISRFNKELKILALVMGREVLNVVVDIGA